jgi:Fe-S cluster assembly iron-binding protein IscA
LSYDLKFDKTRRKNDKIFINEITITEKSFLYLAGTVLEFWRNKRKGFVLIIQMQRTCGCGESFSL